MNYGRVPLQYLKADCLAPEADYVAQSLKCKEPRKASAEEIAKLEAELAAKAKRNTLAYSISAEIGKSPKVEKKPDYPFEFVPKREKIEPQYNPVKFDRMVAG